MLTSLVVTRNAVADQKLEKLVSQLAEIANVEMEPKPFLARQPETDALFAKERVVTMLEKVVASLDTKDNESRKELTGRKLKKDKENVSDTGHDST